MGMWLLCSIEAQSQPSVHVCRALDGDVVAVELLPESQWRGASSTLPQADAESATGGDDPEDDPEGGHIAQVQLLTSSSEGITGDSSWLQSCTGWQQSRCRG